MLTQAGLFLLDTLVGFLCFALLLRFYLQAFRVSFRNQVGAFVVQLTNWLVIPLRRLLPGVFGLDLSCLLPAHPLEQASVAVDFKTPLFLPSRASLWSARKPNGALFEVRDAKGQRPHLRGQLQY